MRISAFLHQGASALGVRVGDELLNLTEAGLPGTLDQLLRGGPSALEEAKRAQQRATSRVPVAGVQWLAPVALPSKAIAVGLNYVDHAAEGKMDPPTYPVLFNRFPSSWVAHEQPLLRPHVSTQFDYEGELVVVIGRAGRYIDKSKALDHVAGYSIFNDGSIRDYQFKAPQWTPGKNFDDTGAFGPHFVTADELPPGCAGLKIETRLNGKVVQSATISDMVFPVARLVSILSSFMTLVPGDVIVTGTPAGVGVARKPPLFMRDGDVCEVEIEGIGVLVNPVRDRSAAVQSRVA